MRKIHRKVFEMFEIAAKRAAKNRDRRTFYVGAIGIRNDGTMVMAWNGSSKDPNRVAHAEYRLASKLDQGAVVYVARICVGKWTFGLAKPCRACQKILKSKKVRKIFYSIGPDEYGVIEFKH
jgi:tRNA(Arg) A34 adenosine deaminase TadA